MTYNEAITVSRTSSVGTTNPSTTAIAPIFPVISTITFCPTIYFPYSFVHTSTVFTLLSDVRQLFASLQEVHADCWTILTRRCSPSMLSTIPSCLIWSLIVCSEMNCVCRGRKIGFHTFLPSSLTLARRGGKE